MTHKPARLLLLPLLIVAVFYPIGINTNLATYNWWANEVDPPAPTMILADISEGFARSEPVRPHQIFYSMVTSLAYVPYIALRTGMLPPYDRKVFEQRFPLLKSELIIVSRVMNIAAAAAIVSAIFYFVLLLTSSHAAALFSGLAAALNANLMFQSSVTFYENWSVLWVILSMLCFFRFWSGERIYANFTLFLGFAMLAVSTHERMAGYFLFSVPAAAIVYARRVFRGGLPLGRKIACCAAPFLIAGLVLFFAQNCAGAGTAPIAEYLKFKSSRSVNFTPERLTVPGLLNNQLRCQLHAAWLIFWNLGGLLPFLSLAGAIMVFRRGCRAAAALLLFPLGYQVLSVGLPGWTSGRYILGQTICATLFAGLGFYYATAAVKTNRAVRWFAAAALAVQLALMVTVKFADMYYHHRRVIESWTYRHPGSTIGIRGFGMMPGDWCAAYGVRQVELKKGDVAGCALVVADPALLDAKASRDFRLRVPPSWLVFLMHRQCYLYSMGLERVAVQTRR